MEMDFGGSFVGDEGGYGERKGKRWGKRNCVEVIEWEIWGRVVLGEKGEGVESVLV